MTAAWLPTQPLPRERASLVDEHDVHDVPERPMRALSVQAPWAWLLCAGYKPVENRTWKPPLHGRESWFVLHAGKREDRGVAEILARQLGIEIPVVCSACIGAILVDGYVTESSSPWFVGPIGWTVVGCVLMPEPITGVRGMLGAFGIPVGIEDQIREKWLVSEHRRWVP